MTIITYETQEIDYTNALQMGQIMSKIKELKIRYYVGLDGEVMVSWQGDWAPYHEVMSHDKRLVI